MRVLVLLAVGFSFAPNVVHACRIDFGAASDQGQHGFIGAIDCDSANECAYSQNAWNAPNGALILSQSDGVLGPIFRAINEQWTHVMISLGPSWVAQNTMVRPATSYSNALDVCGQGPNNFLSSQQLGWGWPGAAQQQLGAVAAYYSLERTSTGGVVVPRYVPGMTWNTYNCSGSMCAPVRHDPAGQTGTWIWASEPYYWTQAFAGMNQYAPFAGQGFYKSGTSPYVYWIHYQPYSFMNSNRTEEGTWFSNNGGMVCSTYVAYAHATAGNVPVAPKSYTNTQVLTAANNTWNTLYHGCMQDQALMGGFYTAFNYQSLFGACTSVSTLCQYAANQTVNCFSQGGDACAYGDGRWQGYLQNYPWPTATSVSPKQLKDGLGRDGYATAWGGQLDYPIQYSGPQVFSCFY